MVCSDRLFPHQTLRKNLERHPEPVARHPAVQAPQLRHLRLPCRVALWSMQRFLERRQLGNWGTPSYVVRQSVLMAVQLRQLQ